METASIFISHASKDDKFVKKLREKLEGHGLAVWADSRELRGGDKLDPVISRAIEQARQVLVVLSPQTINSRWVLKEVRKALAVEQCRAGDGYRVIPLLLPGVEPSALALWFNEEPVGVPIELAPGELDAALPAILAALGVRLSDDEHPIEDVAPQPVAELLLKLSDVELQTDGGKRRVAATATLVYDPAEPNAPEVESRRFRFSAPLGPIEADDLRWYLESYYLWPVGVFRERAARVEAQLPRWGQALYEATLAQPGAQAALSGWQAATGAERRFSVLVDPDPPDGASAEQRAAAAEAASALLGLPWELLHDGRGYLFQGAQAARVRRRLPNRRAQTVRPTGLPIRVLLVSPRPEDDHAGYLDHRSSALPLVEAVEKLGELVELQVLNPPTFAALREALDRANKAGAPFDVIHFDGHGVYDREHGLGALCFEDPKDAARLVERASVDVGAGELAALVRDHRIPLVFLEACQTAAAENDPTASVAARLLEEGVTSVVAMSHSVLVETARRFVEAFYAELARGARVGAAMLAGQQVLYDDTYRGAIMGAGELRLQDWFVPVLYQERHDPQLITRLLPEQVQQIQAQQRESKLGELPPTPPHHFHGRSRELLALERLLHMQRYAVVRGQGGEGKTTLASELARWLVRSRRFRRAAFVSLEEYSDARAVLDSLGRQLLPGRKWSVADYRSLDEARQHIDRALRDTPTLIVLDNMESMLPDLDPRRTRSARRLKTSDLYDPRRTRSARRFKTPGLRVLRGLRGSKSGSPAPIDELFALCIQLLDASPATRLLFTSREALPAPFDQRMIGLGPLSRADAIALVGQVLAREGLAPKAEDPGGTPQEISDLVEAVERHARALVLLAPEVARRGVRAATANLRMLMAELHARHPGDRENSLYASVELSLRRLPPDMRERLPGLGVFYGGAHLGVLAHVLEIDIDAARELALALIEVGLGADMGYGHLRFDPALPSYVLAGLSAEEAEHARARWADAMVQLVHFLYQQLGKDAQLGAQLTLLELPNLLALLDWIAGQGAPEEVVRLASRVEQLLADLGQRRALARATQVREVAARALEGWSHAQFATADKSFDRLLERGDLQGAYAAAQQLLQRCLSSGEAAYPGAAYDIAMAHFNVGRVLKEGGAAEVALVSLVEARRRFQALAGAGNTSAERMASVAIVGSGDCLTDLGRLDEAAVAYEEGIGRAGKLDDKRQIAANTFQLGTVRVRQRRYAEALKTYTEAREQFARLGEPRTVANIWHGIGMVHRDAGQFEQAEHAFRQALAIDVQQKDLAHEAAILNELGNLYGTMGRQEEAAAFYRQAADLYVRLQNLFNEGRARGNLTIVLIKLRRYDEARRELERAIECNKPYGHAAQPWKTWDILHDLEQASENAQAAIQARARAVAAYLAYRRDGGENQNPGARLCALVAQAIRQGDTTEAEQVLAQFLGADAEPWARALVPALQAILDGSRDAALAADPALDYDDAVELQLLLERLGEAQG